MVCGDNLDPLPDTVQASYLLVPSTRVVPAAGYLRRIIRDILDAQQSEPGLPKKALVLTWWHEETEADRATDRELLV